MGGGVCDRECGGPERWPVFATTMAGTVVWRASYLPFGGVHVTTGAPIDLRFPGQWFQAGEPDQGSLRWSDPPANGLHQNWMRDYDPTTGRYVQADPLGLVDGASVYGYARQSPMRYTDPTGQCPWCAAAGWFAFWLVVDILTDEDDCYTWDDFTEFVTYYAIPGRAGVAIRVAQKASGKGAGGGGGNAGRPDWVPDNWVSKTTSKGGGTRYTNPTNPHDFARVMPGNPDSPNPAQRVPYVIRSKNGTIVDVNGNPVSSNDPAAHIPLSDFTFW